MKPALTYTLARFGLLVAVFAVLLPIPSLSLLVKALLALLITMPLSWFLLRGMRERTSAAIAEGLQRRRQRREQLRAALAGEDPDSASPAEDPDSASPGEDPDSASPAEDPDSASSAENRSDSRQDAASAEPDRP